MGFRDWLRRVPTRAGPRDSGLWTRISCDEKTLRICAFDHFGRTVAGVRSPAPKIQSLASSAFQQCRGQRKEPGIATPVFGDGNRAEEDLGCGFQLRLFARPRYWKMG